MCVLNNEPSTIRLALTDLNPVDFYSWLGYIDVTEVAILLMTYLKKDMHFEWNKSGKN